MLTTISTPFLWVLAVVMLQGEPSVGQYADMYECFGALETTQVQEERPAGALCIPAEADTWDLVVIQLDGTVPYTVSDKYKVVSGGAYKELISKAGCSAARDYLMHSDQRPDSVLQAACYHTDDGGEYYIPGLPPH